MAKKPVTINPDQLYSVTLEKSVQVGRAILHASRQQTRLRGDVLQVLIDTKPEAIGSYELYVPVA